MSVVFRSSTGVSCFLATPGPAMQIGRRPERSPRSVRVKDMLISRNHFSVALTPASIVVEDTGSTSGTYKDGQQIRRAHVRVGDRITINADLTFTVAAPDESLATRLVRGPLDTLAALRMVRPIVWHLLVMLHERSEHHGALDPSQILLAPSGAVTLLDHGWNAVLDDGGFSVDARYLAPETVRERVTYPGSDLFALGCILREATGDDVVPGLTEPGDFDRPSHDEVLHRIDKVIADLTGTFYREPTRWLCRHPAGKGLVVSWRAGTELIVRVAIETPVPGGFGRMVRERFAAWAGRWPKPVPGGVNHSPTTDEVEEFLSEELGRLVPGFSVSRIEPKG